MSEQTELNVNRFRIYLRLIQLTVLFHTHCPKGEYITRRTLCNQYMGSKLELVLQTASRRKWIFVWSCFTSITRVILLETMVDDLSQCIPLLIHLVSIDVFCNCIIYIFLVSVIRTYINDFSSNKMEYDRTNKSRNYFIININLSNKVKQNKTILHRKQKNNKMKKKHVDIIYWYRDSIYLYD